MAENTVSIEEELESDISVSECDLDLSVLYVNSTDVVSLRNETAALTDDGYKGINTAEQFTRHKISLLNTKYSKVSTCESMSANLLCTDKEFVHVCIQRLRNKVHACDAPSQLKHDDFYCDRAPPFLQLKEKFKLEALIHRMRSDIMVCNLQQ